MSAIKNYEKPICISHILENIEENFREEASGSPVLVFVRLSAKPSEKLKGIYLSFHYKIACVRFNVNAFGLEPEKLTERINYMHKIACEENKDLEWNHEWEIEAKRLLEMYRNKLYKAPSASFTISEDIAQMEKFMDNEQMKFITKKLKEKGFKWITDVTGDGSCYYRAILKGYFEALICGEDKMIDDFINLYFNSVFINRLQKQWTPQDSDFIKYLFEFGAEGEEEARQNVINSLVKLKSVRKAVGKRKALQLYFLDSIIDGNTNFVIFINYTIVWCFIV